MIDLEAIRRRDAERLEGMIPQDTLSRAERDRHLLLDYIDDLNRDVVAWEAQD